MKVLVVSAGVIGSFNAARLLRGGVDVTLLARGERLTALRKHGVVLEDWRTRQRSVTPVPVVDRIEPGSGYNLAAVIVRRDQIASVLPLLAASPDIPSALFLGNNLAGSSDMSAALGSDRVLTGMVNAGGQRDGVVVRYVWSHRLPLLLGESDGVIRARTHAIAEMFSGAGLPARVVPDAEAYQKTHAAGLPAFAGALYSAGGNIRRLRDRRDFLHLFITGYRDGLAALRADGTAIRPRLTQALVRTLSCCCAPVCADSSARSSPSWAVKRTPWPPSAKWLSLHRNCVGFCDATVFDRRPTIRRMRRSRGGLQAPTSRHKPGSTRSNHAPCRSRTTGPRRNRTPRMESMSRHPEKASA